MQSSGMDSTRIVVQPNGSLSRRQACWFMGSISVVCLGSATVFAVQGFWPVLPFAGLELAALGLALWASLRRNAWREVLHFDGDRLVVERGMVGQGVQSRCEWPRGLTRALMESDFSGERCLILQCGAQRTEIGRCLGEADRAALHARLRELLRPGWQNTQAQRAAQAVPLQPGE